MLGGARTLTLGGYPGDAAEPDPADRSPPAQPAQRATPVELVLVFDKSGSMAEMVGGVSKIEVARQAVAEAVRLMPPSDAIGVLAFDSKAEVVAPMAVTPRRQPRSRPPWQGPPWRLDRHLAGVRDRLSVVPRRRAGRPPRAGTSCSSQTGGLQTTTRIALLGLARAGGVELSVVAIGSNANRPLLEELARATGGRAYFPDNLRDLPARRRA